MFLLVGIIGCVPLDPEYYQPASPPVPVPLTYAAQGLDGRAVEDACDVWSPEGVSCLPAEAEADLRVTAYPGCLRGDDGEVLGWHHGDDPGAITVFLGCLEGDDELVPVLAHEVGHALGVWFHVWPDCDTVAERGDGSPPICGPAVMNATGTDIVRETVPDHQAFASRNPWVGVAAAQPFER